MNSGMRCTFRRCLLRLMPSIGVIIAERNQIAFYRGLLNKLPIGVESIFNEKTIKRFKSRQNQYVKAQV